MTDVLKIPEAAKALGAAMPERLWTIDDVADFMVLSQAQADYAVRQPGAPVPIVLPSKGTGT